MTGPTDASTPHLRRIEVLGRVHMIMSEAKRSQAAALLMGARAVKAGNAIAQLQEQFIEERERRKR